MLHIVLCDDDAAFTADLAQRIEALPAFSPRSMRVRCLTDPAALLADEEPCDLLLLDIDLGQCNGIEVARTLRRTRPDTVLIFVTNYKEYAPEGYEVNAFATWPKGNWTASWKPTLRTPWLFAVPAARRWNWSAAGNRWRCLCPL